MINLEHMNLLEEKLVSLPKMTLVKVKSSQKRRKSQPKKTIRVRTIRVFEVNTTRVFDAQTCQLRREKTETCDSSCIKLRLIQSSEGRSGSRKRVATSSSEG